MEAEPLNVFSSSKVLVSFTAVTKDCKFSIAALVSTELFKFAGVSVPFTVVDANKLTL